MMNSRKKVFGFILAICISMLANSATFVFAQGSNIAEQCVSAESSLVMPRAEVTEYKYLTKNGIRYKRLWSVTYGRWIDPVWTIA